MELPAWLASAGPPQMSRYLWQMATGRKATIFAHHLCRCFPQVFTDPRSLAALDAADRFDDGEIDKDVFQKVREGAYEAAIVAQDEYVARPHDLAARSAAGAAHVARELLLRGFYPEVLQHLRHVVLDHAARGAGPRKNPIVRAMRPLFFELFGDIENPVALDPAWRTEAVVGLAAGIYANRAFDRLPVLADALEDAGCADADVLGHCRGPGPHARGCWVVDLLLGKT